MKYSSTLFFLFIWLATNAQTDLKIGEWRSHLPYRQGRDVTQSQDKVFYATDFSVLAYDKNDGSTQRISKVDGLSNVGISNIKYVQGSEILTVIYDDGVIDLVKPDTLVTLFFIQDFVNFVGDKNIHDIHVENDSIIWLSANYGLSRFNVVTNKFMFTTFTNNLEINNITTFHGFVYAAAQDGVYRIRLDHPFPEDFGEWEKLGVEEGFPSEFASKAIETYNDQVYIDVDNILYRYNVLDEAEEIYADTFLIEYLTAEGEHLLLGGHHPTKEQGKGLVLAFDAENDFTLMANNCYDIPLYAIEDEQGRIWFADQFRDYRIAPMLGANCDRRGENSPWSANNRELMIDLEGNLWVASGGITRSNDYLNRRDGYFSFIDGNWRTYNETTTSELQVLQDYYVMEVHPETGDIYAGSFFDGIMVFDGENYTYYDDSTSSMTNAVGDGARTRVGGMDFDQEGNLWVSNHLGSRPLSVQRTDGSWENFAPCSGNTALLDLTVDANGFKWAIVSEASAGLIIFDEKENRCRELSTGNSNLPTNVVNAIEVDLDGDVWVGTSEGVVVFECGSNVFDTECQGSRRIVEVGGFGGFLLKDESVRAIAVDGANRKWFGTTNGIFVQSPDGETQIDFINKQNSPLFDNLINDIVINNETGEVYIGTGMGIQSFRTDALSGGTTNSSNVTIFPNPVRPEYNGPIAIKGLARDANVKITDVNGQLVYETEALGGQAIWDGRDYNGKRAASGVYLIFSTNDRNINNPDAVAAKLLFLN